MAQPVYSTGSSSTDTDEEWERDAQMFAEFVKQETVSPSIPRSRAPNIDRGRVEANARLMADYFCDYPTPPKPILLKPILKGNSESFLPITGHKLNGHNFLQWSQSVMLYIRGRGKEDHLTRVVPAPKPDEPSFKSWKSENNMVMAWLINSMTLEIGEIFHLYSTAQEIWEAARDNVLKHWQQLDLYEVHEWKCYADQATIQKMVEMRRIFKFLMGLNKDLDEVRG
ncbi:hypothetical protein OSB04_011579 [Centaurea solstitialis]|uniref:Retrotransposon Copia-like N-terminal domain-containing protein n=1 Tax=Centaurea solstitialis TaxID=347529 RepID=A0AA38T9P3_9ASTR|nr:hypothetical protein OSB04_011579 [Centaurea solstitialis]